MSVVSIGDIDVAYTEAGAGEPVVLVHGLAEDRSTWEVQQEALQDVRTYAYDLRGHGDTALGAADGSLDQLGRDLVGFLERVTGKATIVGFSLGGTVALWAAVERPDLVTQAIVLGTSSVVGRAAADFYRDRIDKAVETSAPEFRRALREDTAAALYQAADRLDDVVARRVRAVGDGRGYVNAARAMAALHEAPLTSRLSAVKAHVDVVSATQDTLCPAKAARMIVEAVPDATHHEIDGAGHLMNIDNPDAVTSLLRACTPSRTGRN